MSGFFNGLLTADRPLSAVRMINVTVYRPRQWISAVIAVAGRSGTLVFQAFSQAANRRLG